MQKRVFQKYLILCLTFLCLSDLSALKSKNKNKSKCVLPRNLAREIDSYKPILKDIKNMTTNGFFHGLTFNELATFVNKFSSRISGSKTLERSIDYMLEKSKNMSFDNVHGEEVMVPRWIRGKESVKLLKPLVKNIPMLGLGYSVGTPQKGITAKAVVVRSFSDLILRANEIPGRIVVFNQEYVNYNETVKYRSQGAIEAAKFGAVAVLIRSITPSLEYIPHTGMMDYNVNVTKIPAACITVSDAQYLNKLADEDKEIIINLKMNAKTYPNVKSRNVIAEITGLIKPENVVVISGHIDNWDVGQGAMDDGGGAFISWSALALLKYLGLKPKRTIRTILWTAEEFGLIGSSHYINIHKLKEPNLQFVMESDAGTFTPLGLQVSGTNLVKCIIERIFSLLKPEVNFEINDKAEGPDIDSWINSGVPGASLWNANEKYFWYHHTKADTIDLENPEDLDKGTALFASVAYVLADINIDLPRNKLVIKERI
ncbi:PREDICTED: carboxypeptidase Q-like [Ceratosolen solmsi marchali]|uniref:Carboxypeptidase Q n=1 Tax=Ceratosolen solmsi marchali TaxID=326594 RepID=A0AAJ6YHN2_9HYME|nr:PREDICTED: carboxypeptidase Q-like [Ceratosolen solmsi marchali]